MMCADLARPLKVVHAKSAVALEDNVVPFDSLTFIGMCACFLLMQYAPRLR
jgi:hypothetical protein